MTQDGGREMCIMPVLRWTKLQAWDAGKRHIISKINSNAQLLWDDMSSGLDWIGWILKLQEEIRPTCDLVTCVLNRCERSLNVWFVLRWPCTADAALKSKNQPVRKYFCRQFQTSWWGCCRGRDLAKWLQTQNVSSSDNSSHLTAQLPAILLAP